MKKARRLFALVLAGCMLFSMTAMAKEVGAPVADYDLAKPAEIVDQYGGYVWTEDNGWTLVEVYNIYDKDPTSVLPNEIVNGAIDEDKLVGEYMNNAVTGIWAMDKVIPVAQGGKVIVDGVESNMTFSVLKPELSRVYSAKDFAKSLGGTVLNVVKVDIPAELKFTTASVNFYTPGIVTGQNVKVYAYANGSWVESNVTEVRDDHVVVDVKSEGILAFIEVPAEVPAE